MTDPIPPDPAPPNPGAGVPFGGIPPVYLALGIFILLLLVLGALGWLPAAVL